MFESLDEQLKLDAHKSTSSTERIIRWVLGIGIAQDRDVRYTCVR